ncbi:MAG TPA: hypothetical protein VJ957_07360 [Longimicrobiales bacterium]|nr:hypothetical protein [Longimicrobiales bacterium]
MGLTTLTKREREWHEIAQRALEDGQAWERCTDCLRFHPVGYDGPCDDPGNRLPAEPADLSS